MSLGMFNSATNTVFSDPTSPFATSLVGDLGGNTEQVTLSWFHKGIYRSGNTETDVHNRELLLEAFLWESRDPSLKRIYLSGGSQIQLAGADYPANSTRSPLFTKLGTEQRPQGSLSKTYAHLYNDVNATEDRWYCSIVQADYVLGEVKHSVLDPRTGDTIVENTETFAVDRQASPYTDVALDDGVSKRYLRTRAYANTDYGSDVPVHYLASIDLWDRSLSTAEMISHAMNGFAEINNPSGLVFSWNFMRQWAAISGDVQTVLDASPNGNHGKLSNAAIDPNFGGIAPANIYVYDNPVPVFLLSLLTTEAHSLEIGAYSANAGTLRVCAYPQGTPQPSDADIFAGVGAVSSNLAYSDGTAEVLVMLSGLDTGTTYTIYAIQYEDVVGDYGSAATADYLTATKYSEVITDVTGASVGAQTGIQWAWFDEENPSTLSSPSTQGVAELTDATGLLEITLPTSISTPKGSKGTMVLRADWNGAVQTASHVVEVK